MMLQLRKRNACTLLLIGCITLFSCLNEKPSGVSSEDSAASLKAENDKLEARIAVMEAEKEAAAAKAEAAAAKAEAEIAIAEAKAAKSKAEAESSNVRETSIPSAPSSPSSESNKGEIYFYLRGSIGDAGAEMDMNGRSGTFDYNGIHRILKFKSFNSRTGKLILNEYDTKGKYIGDFVGTYKRRTYDGVFTNTKGGKATFFLYDEGD